MRIIHFPTEEEKTAEQAWLVELEAALDGSAEDAGADRWRELRSDVRALAMPMTPEFERALGQRIADSRARVGRVRRLAARLRSLGNHRRPLVAALGSGLAVLITVMVLVQPWSTGGSAVERLAPVGRSDLGPSGPEVKADSQSASSSSAAPKASSGAAAPVPATSEPLSATPTNRVQQRGASLSLGADPADVQSVADAVTRVVVGLGGFVQSSHVQVQKEGSSGAELALRIPSSKLESALASLGELAPILAESQSTQDITNSYEAARRALSDANAERQALLRALSAASTQGQIDSLRERLGGVSRAIAQDHNALRAVSARAGNSEVDVTVVGDAHATSEGLTLHRGLHDAGHVLLVTLTVLLIGAAVVVPLALLLAGLVAGRGALRRHRRERVLDSIPR